MLRAYDLHSAPPVMSLFSRTLQVDLADLTFGNLADAANLLQFDSWHNYGAEP